MADRPFSWVHEDQEIHDEAQEIEPAPPTYDEHDGATTYSDDSAKDGDASPLSEKQRRISSYSFVDLPEVVPAGTFDGVQVIPTTSQKEVVPTDDPQVSTSKELPEVIDISRLPEVYDETGGKHAVPMEFQAAELEKHISSEPADFRHEPKRLFGMRVKWLVIVTFSLVFLAVALGAGLGAGLQGTKHKYQPPANAFIGTKVSLGGLSRTLGDPSDLALYFQHEDGSVRWMEQDSSDVWHGGNTSTKVALDGKPGTPISVVSYNWDGLDNWRVYYIDNTNTLRETWQATQTWTQGWELGLLNNRAVKAWDNPKAAMVACWYGTTSAANFSDGAATATRAANVLIRMVYSTDATTFQEISYSALTQDWTTGGNITNIDATSTPACFNGQPGTVDYLMVVNQENKINVLWRNLSDETGITNEWTNSSISIPNASFGSTLAYNTYLFAQDSTTNKIKGYSVNFNASDSSVDLTSTFEISQNAGIPQTGIAVTVEHNEFVLVYQTNSTSISNFNQNVSDAHAGQSWTVQGIYIPDK